MRQSKLFTKTRKEAPADETAKNAELLIRGGFIHKNMAGVYEFLPLGLRVMNKISRIVREEMDAIGGQELKMTVLQDPSIWEASGRWSDEVVDNWFKTKLSSGQEVGVGLTHEEPLAKLLKQYVHSYRELPVYPYQIQVKFRNELRAKSGIMRGREFLMKDMYSFSRTQEEHDAFYEKSKEAYMNIYRRAGLGDITFETFASGGIFAKYSHEFQTLTEVGEDTVYLNRERGLAVNKEVFNDEVLAELGAEKGDFEEVKAVEVGNIFTLGTKYSEAADLTFETEDGKKEFPVMGSYGIGVGRLMGVVVETSHDDAGIIWPKEIAPFSVHLISLGKDEEANELYEKLVAAGVDVLFDDRDASAGEKFADSDLIGIPTRVVVSGRSLEAGGVEVKERNAEKGEILDTDEFLGKLKR